MNIVVLTSVLQDGFGDLICHLKLCRTLRSIYPSADITSVIFNENKKLNREKIAEISIDIAPEAINRQYTFYYYNQPIQWLKKFEYPAATIAGKICGHFSDKYSAALMFRTSELWQAEECVVNALRSADMIFSIPVQVHFDNKYLTNDPHPQKISFEDILADNLPGKVFFINEYNCNSMRGFRPVGSKATVLRTGIMQENSIGVFTEDPIFAENKRDKEFFCYTSSPETAKTFAQFLKKKYPNQQFTVHSNHPKPDGLTCQWSTPFPLKPSQFKQLMAECEDIVCVTGDHSLIDAILMHKLPIYELRKHKVNLIKGLNIAMEANDNDMIPLIRKDKMSNIPDHYKYDIMYLADVIQNQKSLTSNLRTILQDSCALRTHQCLSKPPITFSVPYLATRDIDPCSEDEEVALFMTSPRT